MSRVDEGLLVSQGGLVAPAGAAGVAGAGGPPVEGMDQERRIRREIANSNERRRMQSINAGFQSLRTLLPHHEGEKLSKVSHISSSFLWVQVSYLLLGLVTWILLLNVYF